MISIHLSKKLARDANPKATQQINLTGNFVAANNRVISLLKKQQELNFIFLKEA